MCLLNENKKRCIALGSFDGLHRGHMRVIEKCIKVSRDRSLTATVMLFDVHPRAGICNAAPEALLTNNDRDRLLSGLGTEILTVRFSEIRNMSPEEFVKNVLAVNGAQAVCCGFNYRFGRDRAGDPDTLKSICEKYGIDVYVEDGLEFDGKTVSSTEIRKALKTGDIERANSMLGRDFFYTLPVIHGDNRGTGIGFPTANQRFPQGFLVPCFGVYASKTCVGGREYLSVTNIGIRPTVGGDVLLSETNIIGFEGDIYGEEITVSLISYIRGEKRFDSLESLSEQIKLDVTAAVRIYERESGEKF